MIAPARPRTTARPPLTARQSRIALENIPLAQHAVETMRRPGEPWDELRGEAFAALVDAAQYHRRAWGTFSTYAMTCIARRFALFRRRERRRSAMWSLDAADPTTGRPGTDLVPAPAEDDDGPPYGPEDLAALPGHLAHVPPMERGVLARRYGLYGLPVTRLGPLAAALGVSRQTVLNREGRGLGRLRRMYHAQPAPPEE